MDKVSLRTAGGGYFSFFPMSETESQALSHAIYVFYLVSRNKDNFEAIARVTCYT